jgi:formylmethanofuran dehydrogenase subunit B
MNNIPVRFRTAVYGLHSRGTVYRMDNVPIILRAPMAVHTPTDESILAALASRLRLGLRFAA